MESEQKMPDVEKGSAGVEGEGIQKTSVVNSLIDKQMTQLAVDDYLGGNSDFVVNSMDVGLVEQPVKDISIVSEMVKDNQAFTVIEQKEGGSHYNVISDEKMGDRGATDSMQMQNGSGSLEIGTEKALQPEVNESAVSPLKPEGQGADLLALEGTDRSFNFDYSSDGYESGSEEEQAAFMKMLENFFKERSLEFKPPKFYGEGLNCLKLWRHVTKLGGYDQVTSCKLWRQVGESFRPPKTCTTVSWTFRIFYEKALLEYEKHKIQTGELHVAVSNVSDAVAVDAQVGGTQTLVAGRAKRDAAARAMQGWHSQRLLGNGEIGDPIIKDKSSPPLSKRDKQHRSSGSLKRKKPSLEGNDKTALTNFNKSQADVMVIDVGTPADWVKINVQKTKDCYEVYALVPGLLREEVQVQSDPVGRLIISGEPEQPDNPWGVAPFKKVITLPSRIDAHQTSAVVTLHGQLFVRAPFVQSKA